MTKPEQNKEIEQLLKDLEIEKMLNEVFKKVFGERW